MEALTSLLSALCALPFAVQTSMFDPRLILVALIWGANFSFVKYALNDFYPLSFTIVRFSLAAMFLVCVLIMTGESLRIERKDISPLIRLGFIGITLYNILFMYGLKLTSATNSALMISLSPLFAALIQGISKKERITFRSGLGILLSSVGVFLILQGGQGGISFSRHDLAGDLLTICASVCWALYTIKSKPLLQEYSAVKVTAYSMAMGSLLLLPISLRELARQSWSGVSGQAWAAFGFSTFVSGGIAFSLWYQGVQRLGVTRTVVYHYFVPFVAVIFAALFLGERLSIVQIIGGAGILTGVALVQNTQNNP
jgi:drug/metabolite transporter (DMT)-like permease